MWNIKEMRICIEWVKTFDLYCKINPYDQVREEERRRETLFVVSFIVRRKSVTNALTREGETE